MADSPQHSLNTSNYDMASTTRFRSLDIFTGTPQEDITEWISKTRFLLKIYSLDETSSIRAICSALKGTAFDWAKETITKMPEIRVDQLLDGLKSRFLSRLKITEIAKNFLVEGIPDNQENFFKMMRDATYLFENGYMSLEAIVDKLIERSPSEIRIALWSLAGQTNDMFDFAKAAERVIPLAYGGQGSMNNVVKSSSINKISNVNKSRYSKSPSSKSCELHGRIGHSSEECKLLSKLKAIGWTNPALKNCNHVNNQDQNLDDELNSSNYLSFKTNFNENPFLTKGNIEGKQIPVLIDTGADLTLIPIQLLGQNLPIKIQATSQKAQAANGKELSLIGEILNLKMKLAGKIITINKALVTDTRLRYILLGAPEIVKNRFILLDFFNSNNSPPVPTIANIGVNNTLLSQSEEMRIKFSDLFASEISPSKLCTIKRHSIDTGEAPPICQRGQRVQMHLEAQVEEEIKRLKAQGIIRQSESPWRSSLVVVPKDNGKIRICVDYRALNEVTKKNAYPLPRIDEIIDTLAKASIFSTMDATAGYHQIALEENDMQKTAFTWKGELLEYTRMPFGLCNAPATFQSIMNNILKEENWVFAIPYLDDIIVFSNSVDEHKKHLEIVLGKLKAAGLSLNSQKTKFFQQEVEFLGNIVGKGKVKPDPKKISAIIECEEPQTLRDLRSFLGLANYCSEFIEHFATIVGPLTDLLQGECQNSKKKITWSNEASIAFKKIKEKIALITSRAQPDRDKEFILTTDASDIAMGAVLSQKQQNGKEMMISCFSKKFVKAQLNYSTTDKEATALEKGILHYDHYLRGKTFTLRTDHQALAYIKTTSNTNSRILRMALRLQEYSFTPIYIKGEDNIADILSRPAQKAEINSLDSLEPTTSDKAEILNKFHLKSGHGSVNNMKFLMKKHYNWSGIFVDIEDFVNKCKICSQSGTSLINSKNRVILTTHPNELWEIDLIGRFPGSNMQNSFIIVAIDHYTKWMETKIITNKTAKEIVNAIKELIIEKHGIPGKILTDSGLEFHNQHTLMLAKELQFKWEFASPRHHETVGAVERANQTLMSIIKRLCNYGKEPWQNYLQQATCAYNICFNRSINTSPYILKFGKNPAITGKNDDIQLEYSKSEIMQKRDDRFESYKKSIEKGKKTVPYNLEIGSSVLVFLEPLCEKLKEKWHPGYTVKSRILPDAYIVTKNGKEYRVNKAHVKKDLSFNA